MAQIVRIWHTLHTLRTTEWTLSVYVRTIDLIGGYSLTSREDSAESAPGAVQDMNEIPAKTFSIAQYLLCTNTTNMVESNASKDENSIKY